MGVLGSVCCLLMRIVLLISPFVLVMQEMRLSTQEIGFEYQIDFIMKLLETTIEKKKDLVEKTARMLATLCSEEVISPSSIING